MRRSTDVGSMLGQRRRRWANIEPTLVEYPVFAGKGPASLYVFIIHIYNTVFIML